MSDLLSPVYLKKLPQGQFLVFNLAPNFHCLKIKQIHSATVIEENKCPLIEADGIVGSSLLPKAILTADCMPILLLGEKEHAFIHVGWRGLKKEILKNELIKKINPSYAFIGPHIGVLNYQVDSLFKENFAAGDVFLFKEEKIYFNLLAMATIQLNSYYPNIVIEDSKRCTFSDPAFHSYRRNKTTERNWNIYLPHHLGS